MRYDKALIDAYMLSQPPYCRLARQEIWVLYWIERMSIRDIAEFLGLEISSVRNRIQRLRKAAKRPSRASISISRGNNPD